MELFVPAIGLSVEPLMSFIVTGPGVEGYFHV